MEEEKWYDDKGQEIVKSHAVIPYCILCTDGCELILASVTGESDPEVMEREKPDDQWWRFQGGCFCLYTFIDISA